MRVTVCFQLKKSKSRLGGKCPLYLRCTLNGQRFEISTGFFIDPETWIESTQMVKGRTEEVKTINNRLDKIRTKVQDVYNQLESMGQPFDISSIKNKLLGHSNGKGLIEIFDVVVKSIEAKLSQDYSFGTLMQYKTTRKRLGEFLKIREGRKDIPISNIDFNFLNSFDVYIKNTYHVSTNSALNYHKNLKKVLNTAIAMNHITRNPYNSFKFIKTETHRDFLTIKEVRELQCKKISIPPMEFIRDVFVFACYTGLSYSDIEKLNSIHIQKGNDGNDWIIIDRTKTESRCRIPLLPVAQGILNKYENHPLVSSSNRLLPMYSNQKMNCYLKELADICGIRKNITMHVARHTFATSITLSNGVPIETVSKMLGHSSLKTTQIYARIVDSKISQDMEALKMKLGNSHD